MCLYVEIDILTHKDEICTKMKAHLFAFTNFQLFHMCIYIGTNNWLAHYQKKSQAPKKKTKTEKEEVKQSTTLSDKI